VVGEEAEPKANDWIDQEDGELKIQELQTSRGRKRPGLPIIKMPKSVTQKGGSRIVDQMKAKCGGVDNAVKMAKAKSPKFGKRGGSPVIRKDECKGQNGARITSGAADEWCDSDEEVEMVKPFRTEVQQGPVDVELRESKHAYGLESAVPIERVKASRGKNRQGMPIVRIPQRIFPTPRPKPNPTNDKPNERSNIGESVLMMRVKGCKGKKRDGLPVICTPIKADVKTEAIAKSHDRPERKAKEQRLQIKKAKVEKFAPAKGKEIIRTKALTKKGKSGESKMKCQEKGKMAVRKEVEESPIVVDEEHEHVLAEKAVTELAELNDEKKQKGVKAKNTGKRIFLKGKKLMSIDERAEKAEEAVKLAGKMVSSQRNRSFRSVLIRVYV
jgi:hypothetical protein